MSVVIKWENNFKDPWNTAKYTGEGENGLKIFLSQFPEFEKLLENFKWKEIDFNMVFNTGESVNVKIDKY